MQIAKHKLHPGSGRVLCLGLKRWHKDVELLEKNYHSPLKYLRDKYKSVSYSKWEKQKPRDDNSFADEKF